MFTKKELKIIDKINPDEKFIESKEGQKAIKQGAEDALRQSKE